MSSSGSQHVIDVIEPRTAEAKFCVKDKQLGTQQNILTGKAHSSDDDENPDFVEIRISNVRTLKNKRKSSLSGHSKMMDNKELQEDMASTSTNNWLPTYDDPMQASDADQSPSTSDNVTFQLPEGSSSSAQGNNVPSDQPEIESPKYSDQTGRIDSSVENENQVKRRKRISNPPDRFGGNRDDLKGSKKYKKCSTFSGGQERSQPRRTVNADQWLLNLDGVFEEINDFEMFFNQIKVESDDLKDILKVTWDAEFYEQQAKTKFKKVIAEGNALIPKFQDSHDSQTIQKIEDLKKKVKGITTLAKQQMEKLYCRYNAHKLTVEISELEDFMETSLKDVTTRQKDDEATITMENQLSHQLLEKEIRWRQGRIENIKKRANLTPAVLEIGDLRNRLKTVEETWFIFVRNVQNEGKFYQFEKVCEDNSNWFTNAIAEVANNQDYGRDAKQTEALLQDFHIFIRNGAKKSSELEGFAKLLIDEGHFISEKILRKLSRVKSLSNSFQEVAEARLTFLKNFNIFSKQSDEIIKFIENKKKFVSDFLANCAVDLGSLASQIKGHEEEEEEKLNESVKAETVKFNMAVEMITKEFPVVREHVAVKKRDFVKVWTELLELQRQSRKILKEAKDLQTFFENHAKLMSQITCWTNEVKGIRVCKNVYAARANLAICQNYGKEIKENGDVEELMNEGMRLLEQNKLETSRMALTDKMSILREKWDVLKRTVEETLDILKENVDVVAGITLWMEELQERKRLSELIGNSGENNLNYE